MIRLLRGSARVGACSLLLAGCSDLFGPGVPEGAIRLLPVPAEYEDWWRLAERCSGARGEFAAVGWGVVPGAETIPGTDGAVGTYYRNRHQIILVERGTYDGHLVRHEMLHALLRVPGHPREFFVERCGGLSSCGGPCLDEALRTGPPESSAPVVGSRSLLVTAEVRPSTVSLSTGTGGCATIVVRVSNPRPEAVRIRMARIGTVGWSVDGFESSGDGGPLSIDSLVVLPPGAVRSYGFDCPRLIRALSPGDYYVTGRLGSNLSERVLLRITP